MIKTIKVSLHLFYRSGLARWAFMHCIGSSLCFWINTICNETVDTLVQPKVDVIKMITDLFGQETAKKFEGECLVGFWKFSTQKG